MIMKPAKNTTTRQYRGMQASERAEERRLKFLMAGVATFGTKGYARTGIRDLCSAAGLTDRYFYESFTTKEDLLCAVFRMIVEDNAKVTLDILAHADITPREKAAQVLRTYYERLQDDPCRARILFFEVLGVSPRVDSEYLSAMTLMTDHMAMLTHELFHGTNKEDPAAWIIPAGLAGAMVHIAIVWIFNGYDLPLDELVARLIDAFFQFGK